MSEQPQQEPAGTLHVRMHRGHLENYSFDLQRKLPGGSYPLYTRPGWRELSDDEIYSVWAEVPNSLSGKNDLLLRFARNLIEAARNKV